MSGNRKKLTDRQVDIFTSLLGGETAASVGDRWGVSSERIRQVFSGVSRSVAYWGVVVRGGGKESTGRVFGLARQRENKELWLSYLDGYQGWAEKSSREE